MLFKIETKSNLLNLLSEEADRSCTQSPNSKLPEILIFEVVLAYNFIVMAAAAAAAECNQVHAGVCWPTAATGLNASKLPKTYLLNRV